MLLDERDFDAGALVALDGVLIGGIRRAEAFGPHREGVVLLVDGTSLTGRVDVMGYVSDGPETLQQRLVSTLVELGKEPERHPALVAIEALAGRIRAGSVEVLDVSLDNGVASGESGTWVRTGETALTVRWREDLDATLAARRRAPTEPLPRINPS